MCGDHACQHCVYACVVIMLVNTACTHALVIMLINTVYACVVIMLINTVCQPNTPLCTVRVAVIPIQTAFVMFDNRRSVCAQSASSAAPHALADSAVPCTAQWHAVLRKD